MRQDCKHGKDVVSTSTQHSGGKSFPPTVHNSTSDPESATSWQESKFERSQQQSVRGGDESPNQDKFAAGENRNFQFRKMKGGKLGKLLASTNMLFHSGREENKRMKAVLGALSGLAVGVLIFILLFYSFEYSGVAAAIFASVSTIFICIGLAFFPTCRCIMALVIPNFSTGKGRALLLSIIFAGMLSGPILNITHNGKETGNSLACMIDLIANQSKILLRQSKESVKVVAEHLEQQRSSLETVKNSMSVDFKEFTDAIDALEKSAVSVDQNMNKIYEECTSLIKKKCTEMCADVLLKEGCRKQSFNTLSKVCSLLKIGGNSADVTKDIKEGCRKQSFNTLSKVCSLLKIGGNSADVTKDIKDTISQAEKNFNPGMKIEGNFEDNTNNSEEIDTVQRKIDEQTKDSIVAVQTVITTTKYVLSASMLLMFIQASLYFKNYMAKDGYDNMYITKEFLELDKKRADDGEEALLPLKKVEKSEYIHTRSIKLTKQELQTCKSGLAHVFIHAFICFVVVLFDYFLYYILHLVKTFGDVEIDMNNKYRLKVDVIGNSLIVNFYKEIFKSINIEEEFNAHVALDKCLPNPSTPSGGSVAGFLVLYLLALFFVILRGYGMRMRRKIAAYYYPEQEASRIEYLHKTIRHKRVARQRFLRQEVKSAHEESSLKKNFRLSTWLISKCPCMARIVPLREQLECSSCEEKQGKFGNVKLTRCTGVKDDVACTAVYCEDCRVILQGVCPLCYQEEVELRD